MKYCYYLYLTSSNKHDCLWKLCWFWWILWLINVNSYIKEHHTTPPPTPLKINLVVVCRLSIASFPGYIAMFHVSAISTGNFFAEDWRETKTSSWRKTSLGKYCFLVAISHTFKTSLYLLYWLMASNIMTGFQICSNSSLGSNFLFCSPFFRRWNLRCWSTHLTDISNFGLNILLLSSIEITFKIVRFKKQSTFVLSRLKTLSFSYKSSITTIFFAGQCASSDPSWHSRKPLHLWSERITFLSLSFKMFNWINYNKGRKNII